LINKISFSRRLHQWQTIRGIELAEKIKKQQFNLKQLTGNNLCKQQNRVFDCGISASQQKSDLNSCQLFWSGAYIRELRSMFNP
jgi:hypothetical protein